jgi:hypothetical protein
VQICRSSSRHFCTSHWLSCPRTTCKASYNINKFTSLLNPVYFVQDTGNIQATFFAVSCFSNSLVEMVLGASSFLSRNRVLVIPQTLYLPPKSISSPPISGFSPKPHKMAVADKHNPFPRFFFCRYFWLVVFFHCRSGKIDSWRGLCQFCHNSVHCFHKERRYVSLPTLNVISECTQ